MLDFTNVKSPQKVNKDFILSQIDDGILWGYYFGKFDLKTTYKSKFRKDSTPSCSFYTSKSGKLILHDFGTGEKYDIFEFLMKLYHIDFSGVIKKVTTDFCLVGNKKMSPEMEKSMEVLAKFDKTAKKETRIHFQPMKFTDDAKTFWKSFHITRQELELEEVYQIKKLYINDIPIPNRNDSMRFALTEPSKDELLTKVYSPGGTDTLKWVSNIPLDLPFGMKNLKTKSDKCIIAKAVKDMIILKKFTPSVIATQNENKWALSELTLKKLNFHFITKYIAWDADETGVKAMDGMEEVGFKTIRIPTKLYETEGIKDISDLAKAHGLGAVEKLLKQNNII